MVGKRFAGLTVACLLLGLLWFPCAAYQDLRARTLSLANCEDNGLGAWQSILKAYTSDHKGKLPIERERAALATKYRAQSTHFYLKCTRRVGYQWNPTASTTRGAARLLVWCEAPHGFRDKWRNVLLTNLEMRRIREADLQNWIRQPDRALVPAVQPMRGGG